MIYRKLTMIFSLSLMIATSYAQSSDHNLLEGKWHMYALKIQTALLDPDSLDQTVNNTIKDKRKFQVITASDSVRFRMQFAEMIKNLSENSFEFGPGNNFSNHIAMGMQLLQTPYTAQSGTYTWTSKNCIAVMNSSTKQIEYYLVKELANKILILEATSAKGEKIDFRMKFIK